MLACSVQNPFYCLSIAICPLPYHAMCTDIGEQTDLSKRFALHDVGHVHFDYGYAAACYGIAQGDAGMGISAGIEHRAAKTVKVRLLQRVNQRALVVGLDAPNFDAQLFRFLLTQGDRSLEDAFYGDGTQAADGSTTAARATRKCLQTILVLIRLIFLVKNILQNYKYYSELPNERNFSFFSYICMIMSFNVWQRKL